MEIDLPFKAEYAKSGRAGCKGCKSTIEKGSLRLAAMVQSAFHDGKQPNWFHHACFFEKQRPGSVGDIENYENLRIEDQKYLQKSIDELCSVVLPSSNDGTKKKSGGGKKRSNQSTAAEAAVSAAVKDYGIEYSKSGRATCRGCELKIMKDQIRVRKTVYDTEVGMKYGGQALWHHVECFAQLRQELGWLDKGSNLPGFNTLKADDKKLVEKTLPIVKAEDVVDGPLVKKPKLEKMDKEEEKADKALTKTIEKQMKRLYNFRDKIKDHQLTKSEQEEILEYNEQTPIQGDSEKLMDQLADLLTFGALAACKECGGTQLLFHKSGYLCNGELTEWTKCNTLVKEPERKSCQIPSELREKYRFLKDVSKEPMTRAFRYVAPSASTLAKSLPAMKQQKKEEGEGEENGGPRVKRERPPLYNLQFASIGLRGKTTDELQKRLSKLGGRCDKKITEKTLAVFSTTSEISKDGSMMQKARDQGLHIIPVEFLDTIESSSGGGEVVNVVKTIISMSLCDWGKDPSTRLPKEEDSSSKSAASKSIYTKSVPKSITLKIKDGAAVDPDSGLEDVAHVYVAKGHHHRGGSSSSSASKDRYNVVLGQTDIQRNKNSYYKLQLLESDTKNKYWVFRSWGRIGTTIGGNKLESYSNLNEAIMSFHDIYLDKTGNEYEQRDHFVKIAGRMYPIDVDYSEDMEKMNLWQDQSVKSKLPKSVQEVVKLVFDIDAMKRTMIEFDLDMEKMPLGKLSTKQIQLAYGVLTEIAKIIKDNVAVTNSKLIDASNRFYTLIPHDFGVQSPPLLDTNEQIVKLQEMLDSLLEIECAYNLIKREMDPVDGDGKEKMKNPIDKYYEQLKTNLEPLERSSEEFELLERYVRNTHAATHSMYELEIVDIFKVARQGESRRYKPFKKLHNRRLLWHGSRLTNFAGILSHGLKIAPPEAPVTGYMFGKGIYFADMVSKSANYCCTSVQNSTGFLLLSEVALGDMLECTAAKYVEKLPKGKDSCYGRGRTMPNPKESHFRDDGVEIPLGTAITDENLKSSLLYNEFIVYDVAQVNIQYLFRMNFKYKV